MTRQALAELSALLAQRAVLADPKHVAEDALKIARYARAAYSTQMLKFSGSLSPDAAARKARHLGDDSDDILLRYSLAAFTQNNPHEDAFLIRPTPGTPPIQGYPEGYAI